MANKKNIVTEVAKKSHVTFKEAEVIVNNLLIEITETLIKGDAVKLTGFGKFEVRKRAERVGRNINTGETIKIESTISPFFVPGTVLNNAVKSGRKKKKY
ncbi:HU family DNA-binding protein [Lactococcus lactis]|uniref:HU family DNA-binding protein n=1 Tax=Lactococcus lactis TaxID=1358 RepID=UPI000BA5BAF2|nr:HU family DNA-binding protein [Lactococcus lactis]PAL03076.1 hypothetical protein B8W91_09100 [Lactococcus lactis]